MKIRRWWRTPRAALALLAGLIAAETATLTLHPSWIPGFLLGVILVAAVMAVLERAA